MIDNKMMNTKLLASFSFIHSQNNFPADICEYLVIFSTNILNPIEIFFTVDFLSILLITVWLFSSRLDYFLDEFQVNDWSVGGSFLISFPVSSVLGSWSWVEVKEEGGAIFGCQEKFV